MRTKDLVTAALVMCLVACSVSIVLTEVDAAPTSAAVTGLDYDDDSITLNVDKPGIYKARINDSNGVNVSIIDKITIKNAETPAELKPTYSKPMVSGSTYSFILKDTSGTDLSTHTFTLWTVSFNGDGGTGAMTSKVIAGSYSLPECGFTAPTGKVFKAWQVGAEEKAPGESITVGADTEVKAIWKDATTTVNVTFIVDESELGAVDTPSVTVASGSEIKMSGAEITIGTEKVTASIKEVTGHTVEFVRWDGVPAGNTVTSDVTITAIFKKTVNQYTITFDSDGGSAVAPIAQDYGTPVTAPEAPTKTGYTFK